MLACSGKGSLDTVESRGASKVQGSVKSGGGGGGGDDTDAHIKRKRRVVVDRQAFSFFFLFGAFELKESIPSSATAVAHGSQVLRFVRQKRERKENQNRGLCSAYQAWAWAEVYVCIYMYVCVSCMIFGRAQRKRSLDIRARKTLAYTCTRTSHYLATALSSRRTSRGRCLSFF